MKVRGLQQQLAASNYLLPSQRDLLSRLLFQLAFNDFSRLAIFGGSGSGKSTLALALAELFSECQEMTVNVALLQAPMSTEQLVAQLAKQWFAAPHLSATELVARLAADAAHTEWVLIVDDPERLTEAQTDWLLQLRVRLFVFAGEAQSEMQLNLAIPILTLADSEQLLQTETLDTLSLAERFAHSQGSLHKLLAKQSLVSKRAETVAKDKKPLFAAAVGGFLVLLVVSALWLNHDAAPDLHEQEARIIAVDKPRNVVDLPAMPGLSESEMAIAPEQEIALLVTTPEPSTVVVAQSEKDTLVNETLAAEEIVPPVLAEVKLDESQSTEQGAKPELSIDKPESKVAEQIALPIAVYDHLVLLDAPVKSQVVQLAVVSGENALRRFKQSYPQLQVLIYQRSWQGKEQWIIVSGPFTSNAAAKQHIQQLPSSLSTSGPFIKSVGAVQQEILAWQRLKLAKTNQGN